MGRSVTYSEKEKDIVRSGYEAIEKVLKEGSEEEKARLLFCLDKYLDPYFGYKLPFKKDIYILLQNMLFEDNSDNVKEDAIQLFEYCTYPLDILRANIHKLKNPLWSYAKYHISTEDMFDMLEEIGCRDWREYEDNCCIDIYETFNKLFVSSNIEEIEASKDLKSVLCSDEDYAKKLLLDIYKYLIFTLNEYSEDEVKVELLEIFLYYAKETENIENNDETGRLIQENLVRDIEIFRQFSITRKISDDEIDGRFYNTYEKRRNENMVALSLEIVKYLTK